MYELVIIWSNGDKEIHRYDDREVAEEAERGFRMVFGNQIEYSCVR